MLTKAAKRRGEAGSAIEFGRESDVGLEAAISRLHGVVEAAVEQGAIYLVTRTMEDSASWSARIEEALGLSSAKPVILFSRLPRLESGTLDREALRATPQVSLAVAKEIAATIGPRATAVLRRRAGSMRRSHVFDLAGCDPLVRESYEALSLADLPRADARGRKSSECAGPPVSTRRESVDFLEILRNASAAGKGVAFRDGPARRGEIGYAEFADDARRLGAALRAAGLRVGTPVLICLTEPRAMLTAFWACLCAGLVAAPLRTPRLWTMQDPLSRRVTDMARHAVAFEGGESVAPAILSDLEAHESLIALMREQGLPRPLLFASTAFEACGEIVDAHSWKPGEIALLTLTSGSTGDPKCVPLTVENILATPENLCSELGLSSGDTLLNIMSLDHVASLVGFCGAAIRAGARLVVAQLGPILAEPQRLPALLAEERVTRSWAPDFLWRLLAGALEGERRYTFDALRTLISGGESVRRETFLRLAPLLVRQGARSDVLRTSWGMSETTSFMTLSPPWDGDGSHETYRGVLDNGRPMPGNALRVVDADGAVLPEGMVGLLEAKGCAVFPGYLGDQPRADGWMATGDLAEMRDGASFVRGREKEFLVVNGQNIPHVEIEAQVEGVDGVAPGHAAAVSTRNRVLDRDELVVFFTPRDAATSSEGRRALIERIFGAVAGFCGVRPRFVLAVDAADIPKSGIGKLQRSVLRRRFEIGEFEASIREADELCGSERMTPQWRSRLRWTPLAKPEVHGLGGRAVIVLGEGADAARLARACADSGAIVESAPDASALARILSTETMFGAQVEIVDCRLAIECDLLSTEALARALSPCLETARLLASVDQDKVAHYALLTRGAFGEAPGGARSFDGALGAALCGFVCSLESETDKIDVSHIDLSAAGSTDAALAWIAAPTAATRLAERDGAWFGLRLEPFEMTSGDSTIDRGEALRSDGVCLVVGGLGRVGRAILRRLAIVGGRRIAVAGRAASAEARERFEALNPERSDRLCYVRLDPADAESVDAAFSEIRRHFGEPPRSVIHLAAETGPSPLDRCVEADLAAALRPRVDGARNLARALAACGGGSMLTLASVFGLIGTKDHLAHAVGEACALERAETLAREFPSVRQQASAWAPWRFEDAPAALLAYLERRGLLPATPLQALATILAGPADGAVVTVAGVDLWAPAVAGFAAPPAGPAETIVIRLPSGGNEAAARARADESGAPLEIEPLEAPASGGAKDSELLRRILAIWREALSNPGVAADSNFFDAGGSSILAARVHARLRDDAGVDCALIDLFIHPTPRALAASILTKDADDETTVPAQLAAARLRRRARRGARGPVVSRASARGEPA